ncbi:MAG: DHH family phosphoesterase [Nitrososphaerota archaeon]
MDIGASQLFSAAQRASEIIKKHVLEGANILVVGHNDADALSSIGIVCGSLSLLDAYVTARSVARIDEFLESNIENYDLIVFVDLGSGYLSDLKSKISRGDVIIIDHHRPSELDIPSNWFHVNPHLFGIDGMTEISASGLSYLVSRHLHPEAVKYSAMAIVGALGDLQDKNGERRLRGINEFIVNEAKEAGVISMSEDLILYGRSFRGVHHALASTYSPFIPGLSGDEAACLSLVISCGIEIRKGDQWRTLADLSEDEKKRLYNGIIGHLATHGYPSSIASELIGTVYEINGEEAWTYTRDAREFATLLNSTGKTNKAWVGIALAMGVRGWVLEEANRLLEEYRKSIARAINYVTTPGALEQMHHIVILRGGTEVDPRQISSIASILSSSQLLPQDKPLIAIAQEGGLVKVSARASSKLVDIGLDLGEIMRRAAEMYGGKGGGHRVAAGAEIAADRLTLFLLEVDKLVGMHMRDAGLPAQSTLDET